MSEKSSTFAAESCKLRNDQIQMSDRNFTYGVEAFVETIGETSRVCFSDEFFKEYEQKHNHEIAKLRSDLFDGKTGVKYTCLYCGGEVSFRGGLDGHGVEKRRLHAFHLRGAENCPYKDKKMPRHELIKAKQFHGLQTGEDHEAIKHEILWRLENIYSASVEEEKRVYSVHLKYRQADLLATFTDKQMAVEVQISTLDLSTVNLRNKHYRDLGIYIIWVLDKFSPKLDQQSFTQQRILVTNEYNVFAFDEEAKIATHKNSDNELYLHCYYSLFDHNGEELGKMEDEIIPFSALHFRETDHMVYYKCKEQLIEEAIEKHKQEEVEKARKEQVRQFLIQQEEERQVGFALDHINWIIQRKINDSTGKEYNIRDLDNKYHVITKPSEYIKKAMVEFIYRWVNDETHNTSSNEPKINYNAIKDLIGHAIKYEWLDVDELAKKGIMGAIKTYIDTESRRIINSQILYNKEDLRRYRLEWMCYIYSLLKLQQNEANSVTYQDFDKHWRFISKLYSLFTGQIVGSAFPNFASQTNEISRQNSFSYPYAYLYVQAYDYCLSSGRPYSFKFDESAKRRYNALKTVVASQPVWKRKHDLDYLVDILFSIPWNFD